MVHRGLDVRHVDTEREGSRLKSLDAVDKVHAVLGNGHVAMVAAISVVSRLFPDRSPSNAPAPRTPHPAPAARDLSDITRREREVLTLVGRGMSNSEIAEHLHLTVGTVKTHIGRLPAKLGARDRAQLVIAAYEGGLVTVTDGR
ncbi:hypothetical protein GCM10022224_052560 [Nonomuraea antimicrobica]|uniref:HTH luxR-type domain-containing protein n=2 Tax=Nonomuraea antimicrobica TaxID=561173 RepID=A0ABP7C6P7_9ACTN